MARRLQPWQRPWPPKEGRFRAGVAAAALRLPEAACISHCKAHCCSGGQQSLTSGRLPNGIYHFLMVYTIAPMIYTTWNIPRGMYQDIYHGIKR
jgi:hypothetical protein